MPEFIMNGKETAEFHDLPEFVQGYIEAMFFTENAPGVSIEEWTAPGFEPNEGSVPEECGFDDIHPDSLTAIRFDCAAFQVKAGELLAKAYEMEESTRHGPEPYTATRAGHDFWYCRNGHGTGFWDRDLGDVGDHLSRLARGFGEAQVWFADHVDYGNAPFVYHH